MKLIYKGRSVNGVIVESSPWLASQAKGLIKSGGRIVRAALRRDKVCVSDEEKERRLAICAVCEFYTGKTCRKCGCVIRFKARLATEHCPIQKW